MGESERTPKFFCRDQIVHYTIPRFIRFVDESPVTITGRMQKLHMRELAMARLAP